MLNPSAYIARRPIAFPKRLIGIGEPEQRTAIWMRA
jgi:hypothetical protein